MYYWCVYYDTFNCNPSLSDDRYVFSLFMSGSSSQRRTKSESEMKLYSLDVHADLKAVPIDDSSPPPPDEPPNDKQIPEVQ